MLIAKAFCHGYFQIIYIKIKTAGTAPILNTYSFWVTGTLGRRAKSVWAFKYCYIFRTYFRAKCILKRAAPLPCN